MTDNLPSVSLPEIEQAFTADLYSPTAFVDRIILGVVKLHASDLLIEPMAEGVRVRARIDGVLYRLGLIPNQVYTQILARLKVLAKLDPTEKRRIQEGQYTIEIEGRTVNLRLEVVQVLYGEMVVIRIHEKRTVIMNLTQLGFNDAAYKTYLEIINTNNGLVLVSGPTGCGKSTTLYSTITYLNRKQNYNVLTVEDPIEYQLQGANQMQTSEEPAFTFADGLKSILRLSPDIIFVGEIRDRETARIAIESGLTGQLVFSSIHAQDSVSTLYRLLDLGIEAYLLNAAVKGIIAQRLVRRNCQYCLEAVIPTKDEVTIFQNILGRPPAKLSRSKGCVKCGNLAYQGRTALFEVLKINEVMRELIRSHESENMVREAAKKEGLTTLVQDGLQKCEVGITTIEEVWRTSMYR